MKLWTATEASTILRLWLAVNLAVCGLVWVVVALSCRVDAQPFWLLRRALAVLLGAGLLAGAYLLVARFRSRDREVVNAESSRGLRRRLLACAIDGFLVFSLASFLFNLSLVLFRRYDFDPTFDVLHLIPVLIANIAWEALISRTGGSLILFFSSVVIFDGLIGALVGMALSPRRSLIRRRAVFQALLLGIFCGFELVLATCLVLRF